MCKRSLVHPHSTTTVVGIQTRCPVPVFSCSPILPLRADVNCVTIFDMEELGSWPALVAACLLAACGARTGLPHGQRAEDAGLDASADADVPDVANVNCEEAGVTYIYLMSEENKLLRFYPPSRSFDSIGNIACPASTNPFSMAVDRRGIGYVLFHDGLLFRVSTLTASCQSTAFAVGQQGFPVLFGMGFSSNTADAGETLFVVGAETANWLATVDASTFELDVIGDLGRSIGDLELTGTGDGRLFGFAPAQFPGAGAHLAEIDKSTAAVLSDVTLDLGATNTTAWAFAFWGGDFYFFTAETSGHSVVHRYTPGATTTPPVVADIDVTIVGAGVSTCAPAR